MIEVQQSIIDNYKANGLVYINDYESNQYDVNNIINVIDFSDIDYYTLSNNENLEFIKFEYIPEDNLYLALYSIKEEPVV